MSNPAKKFRRIFQAGCYSDLLQLSDGKLRTEDGFTFEIHRIVLARSSEYFRAMFCGFDKRRRSFEIPGISGRCLGEILSYIYTSDISITERNVTDLLIAADYLLLPDLYRVVRERVKENLTTENCLRLYQAAHGVNDEEVSSQCFRHIQIRFEAIVRDQKRQLVGPPLAILEKILSNRSLCVRDETSIWEIILEWTREDYNNRLKYFPQLLTLLAKKDLDGRLAEHISQPGLIIEKTEDLYHAGRVKRFFTDLGVIVGSLESYEELDYRTPECLHVIAARTTDIVEHSSLYITYDEKLDMWRKIGEISYHPDYMIPAGNSIIFFSIAEGDCRKFDLIQQQWMAMTRFRANGFSVVDIDGQIFVFGTTYFSVDHWTFSFELYDEVRDVWLDGVPLDNIRDALAVAVARNIYVVGNTLDGQGMIAFAFDIDNWEWCPLPPPNFFRFRFDLVAFHGNVYLIGGTNFIGEAFKVEVFVPATAKWRELPDLPHVYAWVHAVVWRDQIIVFDEDEEGWEMSTKDVRWNEEMYCWESKQRWETPIVDFHDHLFCELRDVDAVRRVTRVNRNPDSKLEKSYFG